MNCQQAREQFLTPTAELEAHLSTCPACAAEADSLRHVWDRMEGLLPEQEPSPAVSARFQSMLDGYRQGMEAAAARPAWWEVLFPRPAFQAAMATVLVGLGLASGVLLAPRGGNGELASLQKELREMRSLMTVSLMQKQSASERLQAVGDARRFDRPDPQIQNALLETLESDSNVNVRLAAIDALRPMASHPAVRQRLLNALVKQTSPMVQVALIDLMVDLRERQALKSLQEMRDDKQTNPTVRQRAEWAIQQLGGGV
jgi:hypothetical protein